MTNRAASLIAYIVPFLIVAIGMPWGASAQEFESGGLKVVVLAIVVHAVLRYGMPYLSNRWAEQRGAGGIAATQRPFFHSFSWRLLRVACVASLAIGLASLVLANIHALGAYAAFYVGVVCQQLVLVCVGYYIARESHETFRTVLCLVVLGVAAVFFAWSSNIVLEAQQPPVPHKASDSANVLYAIPALAVAVIGIARRLLQR